MKRQFLFFVLLFFLQTFSITASVKDNTFSTVIENVSDFYVTIDNERLAPRGKAKHRFPLHESALYDGWPVEYEIPLMESVNYILQEKLYISDGQKNLRITNPKSENTGDCFLVIHNSSSESFQITDSKKEAVYPCYASGTINKNGSLPIYNIASGKSVVCSIPPTELYAANPILKNKPIMKIDFPHKAGFVYKIDLTENGMILIDKRPLGKICEPLWSKEVKNETVRSIIQKDGKTFLLSTKTEKDRKRNLFTTGILKCMDSSGNEIWKQEYAQKGTDTFLYDAAFSDDGIIAVGQSIGENMSGLVLFYSLDGALEKYKIVPESIGLEMITPFSDKSFYVRGYDSDGNLVYFQFFADGAYHKTKAIAGENELHSVLQSESKFIDDGNGTIYVSGETSYSERSTASIVSVTSNGKITALYTSQEPFSFVSDMFLDTESNQLIFSGFVNAADSFGNGGKPFVRCLDLGSKKILWETVYENSAYEVCAKIAPCADYGYIQFFVNADSEGNVCEPFCISRTNATGKIE